MASLPVFQLTAGDCDEVVEPIQLTDQLKQSIKFTPYQFKLAQDERQVLIIVPTQNELKIQTVKIAMDNYFGARLDTIWRQKAPSGEVEQPVGAAQGVRGACGRINNAIRALNQDQSFTQYLISHQIGRLLAVSVENFISGSSENTVDYAFVVIYNIISNRYVAGFSRGCNFPTRFVNEAQTEISLAMEKTIGDIIEEHNPKVTHDDPHRYLCGVSRYDLIIQALNNLMVSPEFASLF